MRLLEVRGLDAFYEDFQALFGVDFGIDEGETVTIIGANGAGKSTFLRAVTGLVKLSADLISYRGSSIEDMPPAAIVGLGIAMVPEGRRLFPSLSVEENLVIGGYGNRPGIWDLQKIYELFPRLHERRRVPATSLSGGEQQMAAIGRALMANPELLLFDELSLGLAPIVIRDLYATLPVIRSEGVSMIVVEQDISQALAVANRVYCFQEGRVSLTGTPSDLGRQEIVEAYFGRAESVTDHSVPH